LKAVVVYGTGRGTTGQFAEAIVEGLDEAGAEASAIGIELVALAPALLGTADLIGVGTPVYFYREPLYITNFLGRLPRLEGKKAFVFCTCGMDRVGETLHRVHRALRERGTTVVGAESFRSAMSYYPLRRRGFGNSDELPDEATLEGAREFGRRMAQAEGLPPVELPPMPSLTAWKARLLANTKFRNLVFPGVRLKDSACTGYGSCLSRCLVNGLERSDGEEIPHITDTCIHCLECISWCPKGAIVTDSRIKEWLATLSSRLGIH